MDAELTAYEPVAEYVIDTIEKLRVVSNPLRIQILNTIISSPRTVKEIGDQLGITSNTLYYHVAELENAGMVHLVGTAVKSGIQHKYYRASGRFYRLMPTLLYASDDHQQRKAGTDFVAGAVEDAARHLRQTIQSGLAQAHPELIRVARRTIRTTPERATELRNMVNELEQVFERADEPDAPLRVELQFAFFPIADEPELSRS